MLQKTGDSDQATIAAGRVVAIDRARTFITLLVVIHHSVVNYTYFGNGDRIRWLGFDLVVLFNDSFFMAFMFLISGLFVHDSLTRRGAAGYLRQRAWRLGVPLPISVFVLIPLGAYASLLRHHAWRLGVPLLISIFVLIPIAYYASFLRYHLPGTTDFNFFHYWWHMLTIGPWPSGPAWVLWVWLALDAIAALSWTIAPGAIAALGLVIYSLRARPMTAFAAFMIF